MTFKEDKNTKQRTFALHGHGSARDDPTTCREIADGAELDSIDFTPREITQDHAQCEKELCARA